MATPVELERLIVRLVGESSSFQKMVDNATISARVVRKHLQMNADVIESSLKKMGEMGAKMALKAITPMERYQILMREMDALLRVNAIDQETYNRTLEREYQRLPSVIKSQKDYAKSLKATGDELKRASKEQDRLAQRAEANSKIMLRSLDKLSMRTVELTRNAGIMVSATTTAPIVAFGKKSVTAFSDFDDAMVGSIAVMEDVTPAVRKQMEELARGISENSKTGPIELAESYYYLASAGYDAEGAMGALAKTEKFALAGRFQMTKATELLSDAQTALGLRSNQTAQNIKNLTRVSDVLVKADTIANASVEQFAKSLTTKAGNALRLLNKDIEEGVAILAAYAAQGVKAELAGERLYIVLRDLERTSRTNAQAWEHFGIKVYDSQGKMLKVSAILRQLEGVMGKMSDQEKAATFAMLGFQDRSVAAIKGLIGMSDAIDAYEQRLRGATGYTEKVANEQMKSFAAQMAIVRNRVTNVAIDIGQILVPQINKAIKFVADLVKWWKSLSDADRQVVVRNAAIVASIGPILIALSTVISTLRTVTIAVYAFGTAIQMMGARAAAARLLMVALPALIWGIGKGFVEATLKANGFRDSLDRLQKQAAATADTATRENMRWLQTMSMMDDKNAATSELQKRLEAEERDIKGFMFVVMAARETLKEAENISMFGQASNALYGNAGIEEAQAQLEIAEQKLARSKSFIQDIKDTLQSIQDSPNNLPINLSGMEEGEGMGMEFPDFKEINKSARAIERIDEKLRIEAETLGLTSEEVEVYKLALEGASAEQIEIAYQASQAIKAFNKEKKVLEEIEDAAEKARHPFEKFRIEEARLSELLDENKISIAAFRHGIMELRSELARDLNVKFSTSGVEAVRAGSIEALGKLESFRLQHLLPKAELERIAAGKDIGGEFKPDKPVKGFGRKSGERDPEMNTLIDLLRKVEENTRKGTTPGRGSTPVVISPANIGGRES